MLSTTTVARIQDCFNFVLSPLEYCNFNTVNEFVDVSIDHRLAFVFRGVSGIIRIEIANILGLNLACYLYLIG